MASLANQPMKMHSFFLFLVLACTSATATTVVATRNRRTLHQPFFQQHAPILPPVQPPTTQPSTALPPSSPPSLNVPFLSTTTPPPPKDEPFFQSFPSPPPPPPSSSSSASFPANISSLNLPTSPEPKHVTSKLIPIAMVRGGCLAASWRRSWAEFYDQNRSNVVVHGWSAMAERWQRGGGSFGRTTAGRRVFWVCFIEQNSGGEAAF